MNKTDVSLIICVGRPSLALCTHVDALDDLSATLIIPYLISQLRSCILITYLSFAYSMYLLFLFTFYFFLSNMTFH